jgi:hypothetical protein
MKPLLKESGLFLITRPSSKENIPWQMNVVGVRLKQISPSAHTGILDRLDFAFTSFSVVFSRSEMITVKGVVNDLGQWHA